MAAQLWGFRPGQRSEARSYLESLAGQGPKLPHAADDCAFARGTAVRAVVAPAATASPPSPADDGEDGNMEDPGWDENVQIADCPPRVPRSDLYGNSWAGSYDYKPARVDTEEGTGGSAVAALRARVAKLAGVPLEPALSPQPHGAGSVRASPQTVLGLGARARSGALGPKAGEGTEAAEAEAGKAEEEADFLHVLSGWTAPPAASHPAVPSAGPRQRGPTLPRDGKATPLERRARELQEAATSSPLLAQMRLLLAEEKVSSVPPEYAAFCRHLQEDAGDFRRLPVAEVADVPRVARVPDMLKGPVIVETPADWRPRRWSMAFWSYECGEEQCRCFRRYPPFPGEQLVERLLTTRIDHFVRYVGVLRDLEPICQEDSYLAFPRFFVGGWSPFATNPAAKALWEEDLMSGRQSWAPPGIQDETERWVKLFCRTTKSGWKELLSAMDRLQLGPAGAVTRLHVESDCAHAWHAQLQGRRAYTLFAPEEGGNLNKEDDPVPEGGVPDRECRRRRSAADVLRPSRMFAAGLRRCRAEVAVVEPGEILVVPQGWWLYSVTLEPSVTLTRRFWSSSNRDGICDALGAAMIADLLAGCPGTLAEAQECARKHVDTLRRKQHQDYSSDED